MTFWLSLKAIAMAYLQCCLSPLSNAQGDTSLGRTGCHDPLQTYSATAVFPAEVCAATRTDSRLSCKGKATSKACMHVAVDRTCGGTAFGLHAYQACNRCALKRIQCEWILLGHFALPVWLLQ